MNTHVRQGLIGTALAGALLFSGALMAWTVTPQFPSSGTVAPASQNNLKTAAVTLRKAVAGIQSQAAKPAMKAQGALLTGPSGTPFFLDSDAIKSLPSGTAKIAAGASPAEAALAFITANHELFRLNNPATELQSESVIRTGDGSSHVTFDQYYNGTPVDGQRLVVHYDSNGVPYAVNGRYAPTPSTVSLGNLAITSDRAVELTTANLSGKTPFSSLGAFAKIIGYTGPESQLVVWINPKTEEPRAAWKVTIRPNLRECWLTYIDASSGAVLEAYNVNPRETATGIDLLGQQRTFQVKKNGSVYSMTDAESNVTTYDARGKVLTSDQDVVLVTSADLNSWADPTAVSAHANMRAVYDFYSESFGRKGIDDNNMETPVVIHFTEDGNPFDNAFWAGEYMAFGDATPYASALDVVAHETTHGVVSKTVGLEYKFQSGALDESLADFFGCMVDPDWQMGEDLPNGALRDAENPAANNLPADMTDYRDLSFDTDEGGVHINMTIPLRAYMFFTKEIGREKSAVIMYRVLENRYLTPESQFIDMRLAVIQSATDLYGAESDEVASVKKAFDAVGIVGQEATPPPADNPPAEGDQYIVFATADGVLMLGKAGAQASTPDTRQLTETRVFTGSSHAITVSEDGSLVAFVDENNNLRYIDLASGEEVLFEESGIWNSIALSPNAQYFAATTIAADSVIYVLDLLNAEDSKIVRLYTPSDAGPMYTALKADALDWNRDSTEILFDAFHQVPSSDDYPIEFWDVNVMDVKTGIITRLSTPTDTGLQVGNPAFAETNDRYIVCDLFSYTAGTSAMVTIDTYTMQIDTLIVSDFYPNPGGDGQIANLGFPRYSVDDRYIVFQQYDPAERSFGLGIVPLNEDKMSPSGDATLYHMGGILPVWFATKYSVATSVTETETQPSAFSLSANYPNPFNPSTTIAFTVAKAGKVDIAVFNVLGQEVAKLVNSPLSAGSYKVSFDGSKLSSGLYFYRLSAGDATVTRKMTLLK